MKKFLVLLFILCAVTVNAQTPAGATSKIGWEQSAVSLAEAQALTYKYYADTATTGVALAGVTCTGTASPFQCEVAFPAFTPGQHTLVLTASNLGGESPKSSPPLSFTFVLIPSSPANIRIK